MFMGYSDSKETKRQEKSLKRKVDEKECQDKIKKRNIEEQLKMSKKYEICAEDLEQLTSEESIFSSQIPIGQFPNQQAEGSKLLELPPFDNTESETKKHRTKEVTKRNQLPIPNTSETSLR